jgi:hypothetical protein
MFSLFSLRKRKSRVCFVLFLFFLFFQKISVFVNEENEMVMKFPKLMNNFKIIN